MRRAALWALILLALNGAYLAAFAQASIFYEANVVLHLALGWALAFVAARYAREYPAACGIFLAAAFVAFYLVFRGNTYDQRWVLWLHIGLAEVALALIGWRFRSGIGVVAFGLLVLLPIAGELWPNAKDRIENPASAPLSMDLEGAGAHSPFAPSSAQTNTGKIIPSNFFMDSAGCGRCHQDIYEQWKSSAHHFASFNNQFYRKSIEYMQDKVGTRPSKWCAGCHDHAVFFNGRFDRPIREQIDTPEAQAGLGCMSCHAIVHVGGSMGNGDFTVEYPPLHELASRNLQAPGGNRFLQGLERFLIYLNPKPHRTTFMKPFMREQAAEFCAACHKVHLDVPVNSYRWVRGFDDYDNWQASGVSGQGARSFYYPNKSQSCNDCHMPLVSSHDPGNREGRIHSHRFPGANTAVAFANRDESQLKATEDFLKSGFITVDIFAASPADDHNGHSAMLRRNDSPRINSTFAVGEEAEQQGDVVIREVGKVGAPLDSSGANLEPGSDVRVDVVVRTRKIGHFFPGGTVDAFDAWLEFEARDGDGRVIFWSGNVTDGGRGPVEPGAHFYRSFQLDGDGNPIDKRNAWQTRSLLYVRLIPPGAADVAHYLVRVPKDVRGPLQFTARLNYRKFAWSYTQFAYGAPHFIPANVSGAIRDRIPDVPIVTLAEAKATVPLGEPTWSPIVKQKDRERWNDWGIGLLLQGDLKGAEYAFRKVTEAEPVYADGWLNLARALIQEGETDAAKPYIAKALEIAPQFGRTWFFKAAIQKADGDYDGALQSLDGVRSEYPRDRVVLNQIARLLFLKREYGRAIEALRAVNAVDPEDVQMHYTWMLSCRGLGDSVCVGREEQLFRRFKAEESSQALTARRRASSPEDNNERQAIHDHESAVR